MFQWCEWIFFIFCDFVNKISFCKNLKRPLSFNLDSIVDSIDSILRFSTLSFVVFPVTIFKFIDWSQNVYIKHFRCIYLCTSFQFVKFTFVFKMIEKLRANKINKRKWKWIESLKIYLTSNRLHLYFQCSTIHFGLRFLVDSEKNNNADTQKFFLKSHLRYIAAML